jgi:hypothetical protein
VIKALVGGALGDIVELKFVRRGALPESFDKIGRDAGGCPAKLGG